MVRADGSRGIHVRLGIILAMERRIRFANYDRLRIGNGQGYWQTSGVDYQPVIIVRIDQLLQLNKG
jgi:hypothetical protein